MIFAAWSTSCALRSGSLRSAISRTWASVIRAIATKKLPDLNAHDVDQAAKIIAGTARSMGVEVR